MNVRVLVEAASEVWRAQLSLEPSGLSAEESRSLAAHGDFEVAAGGTFDGSTLDDGSLSDVTFTLPSRALLLPAQFPCLEVFTGDDADRKAAVWASVMLTRVSSALATWLALDESRERNTIHTIP